jgi:hypothetical protein
VWRFDAVVRGIEMEERATVTRRSVVVLPAPVEPSSDSSYTAVKRPKRLVVPSITTLATTLSANQLNRLRQDHPMANTAIVVPAHDR